MEMADGVAVLQVPMDDDRRPLYCKVSNQKREADVRANC